MQPYRMSCLLMISLDKNCPIQTQVLYMFILWALPCLMGTKCVLFFKVAWWLRDYEDILDHLDIYSLIALTSVLNKVFFLPKPISTQAEMKVGHSICFSLPSIHLDGVKARLNHSPLQSTLPFPIRVECFLLQFLSINSPWYFAVSVLVATM